jgi:hypothetical protein
MLFAFALLSPAQARAVGMGVNDNCLDGGTINEVNDSNVPMNATTYITDKSTGLIADTVYHGVMAANSTLPFFYSSGLEHCDAYNYFTPLAPIPTGGGGGIGAGASSVLYIESMFFDPTTNQYELEGIFDFMQGNGIASVSIPDLWEAPIGDSFTDSSETLYAVVNLDNFLFPGPAPTFSAGEDFSIIDGTTPLLPGMEFFATAPTFNPATGFGGTPYTGNGIVEAEHDLSPTPEPSSLALFASGLLGLAGIVRRKLRRG